LAPQTTGAMAVTPIHFASTTDELLPWKILFLPRKI